MKIWTMGAAAALALTLGAVSAEASCGDYSILRDGKHHFTATPFLPPSHAVTPGASPIVGLWLVAYTSGGNPVYQGLEQWHSDGLEWEFADIPTITGDVCMGVWSSSGRSISLYHTGWTFDTNGNPNGTMVLTHADKVSRSGNRFSGTFDLKFYDSAGNLVNEITGDDNGQRIAAP
ncbi:MAG TPA: hypothetical protein VGL35_02075 [Rhizomicrobium sp.]|jgi:hypothetical protein